MLLALDVGNTNVTIGVYDGDTLLFVSRMATDASRMEDQYAIELRDILSLHQVERESITGAALSSVVPKTHRIYLRRGQKAVRLPAPGGGLRHPGRPEDHHPPPGDHRPRSDRRVRGRQELYSCPCIVIDMGTATTIMVIDKEGCMRGGGIIPGVGISLDALTSRAALLSSIGLETPEHVIGRDTVECLQSGMLYGTAAMLDGFCDRMEEELGYPCRVVATGGLAGQVIKNCRRKVELCDTLLLDGLKLIYEKKQAQ